MKGRKPEHKSAIWSSRKKYTFNQKKMKKQEFKKLKRGIGTSKTTLNIPTSKPLGCQKEKTKNKKLKTYLKK